MSEGNGKNGSSAGGTTSIKEGSAVMTFPADQESTVFYNPVQVQNRDLSILMITLYGEIRASLQTSKEFQQKTRKELEASASPSDDKVKRKERDEIVKEKVAEFQKNLNGAKAVQELFEDDSTNGLCIFEGLAASGLRSVRYWKEIPGVHHITINDLDPAAVERAEGNLANNQLNNVRLKKEQMDAEGRRPQGIYIRTGDATAEMYNSRPIAKHRPGLPPNPSCRSWDVIDLDPYGSAAPFLDAAIQSVTNGGLLCVTSTDMRALGGSSPEVCFGRYGAFPLQRAPYLQESALRILLQSMATTAAKYGRVIHPILSVGMDFYVRVFVTVHDSGAEVADLSLKIGYIYQSTQCESFRVIPMAQKGGKNKNVHQASRTTQMACPETGAALKIGGPIWLGPLHDQSVVQKALDKLSGKNHDSTLPNNLNNFATKDRLRGLLMSCRDELSDAPLFYRTNDLAKTLSVSAPPSKMIHYALINAGYRVSAYHKEPNAIKTDAPDKVVWDILRAWRKKQEDSGNSSIKPPKEGSAAEKILSHEIETKVDFSKPKANIPDFIQSKDVKGVARFPQNPQANWGPKKAATGFKRKALDQTPAVDSEPHKADKK